MRGFFFAANGHTEGRTSLRGMTSGTTIIVDLPQRTLVKADVVPSMDGPRPVYFEATRDDTIDRQGEMVAADGLWESRQLMLDQGDFDLAHWAHLANPKTGRPMPEYRLGHPNQITRSRDRKSIFCGGQIYNNLMPPPDDAANGAWADRFYHSLVGLNPPAKWFPSVYGRIPPEGIIQTTFKGQPVRRIIKPQWFSVGFATRAQHPTLAAVSTSPVGTLMAKADSGAYAENAAQSGVLHLSWRTFAKALEVGMPITDSAQRTGVQALTAASVDGQMRRTVPDAPALRLKKVRLAILKAIRAGDLPCTLAAIAARYQKAGAGAAEAKDLARALLRDIDREAGR